VIDLVTGLESLEPQAWSDLALRMRSDDALFEKYYRFEILHKLKLQYNLNDRRKECYQIFPFFVRFAVKLSDSMVEAGCDASCREKTICSIIDGDEFLPSKCRS